MSSLASCIKKAGAALLPEDADQIRRIHDDLVAAGDNMAAEHAVAEHIAAIAADRETLAAQIAEKGGVLRSGVIYARERTLMDVARDLSSIDLLNGTETLTIPEAKKVKSTGKLRATAAQLAAALEARTLKQNRGRNLSARTSRNKEILAEALSLETQAAMQKSGHAGDWYRSVIHAAVNIVSEIHPELKTDVNARNIFMLGLSITSNGMDVDTNARSGLEVYQYFKDNGRLPDYGFGDKQASMAKHFALANLLTQRWGLNNFVRFLNTEFTVGELKTLGFEVSGENVDHKTNGSVIFGPKIGGGFFQNLMGNFSPLTMDRWFMRTWGRLTGTLLPKGDPPAAQVDRFSQAILDNKELVEQEMMKPVEEILNDDELFLLTAKHFHRIYARSVGERTKTYGDKTELNKSAKNLDIAATAPIIVPRHGEERAWIREVGELALEKLHARGVDVDAAAMQALVWYPEKELYLSHGVGNAKSKPTDYEQEFAKLARERGVAESSIESARSERPAGPTRGDAGPEPGVEGDVAPAFPEKGRRAFVQRETARSIREQLPRPYRGGVTPSRATALGGVNVRRVYKPEIKTKNAFARAGLATPEFVELEAGQAAAELFHRSINSAKAASPAGAAVYVYTPAEYESMRLFLTAEGKAGFALNGDDIVSLFKDPGAEAPGVAQASVGLAIAEGGRRLDAFDTILPTIYSYQGFRTVARVPWNEDFKPDDWNKKTFERWNDGEPDVVYMVYDRNYDGVYKGQFEGEYVETPEAAAEIQQAEVEALAERNKQTLRYSIDEEIDARADQDPESPLARHHKIGATMETQANLATSGGRLSLADIKTAIRDFGAEVGQTKGLNVLLAAIPRRNLRDFLPEVRVPSLTRYLRLANRMSGRRNELIQPAEALANEWARWARKNKRAAGRLGDLMHASTLAGVDPSEEYRPLKKPENMDDADKEVDALRREQHLRLRSFWESSSDEARSIYTRVRDQYTQQRADLERALLERIESSEADSKSKRLLQDLLRQQFEDGRVSGPYFPLARFGDRWSAAKDAEGNVIAYARFETLSEQRAWNQEWSEAGYEIDKNKAKETEAAAAQAVAPEFVASVTGLIEDKSVQDEIWQLYLRSLPEMSMRKRFIHRKGRIGFAADALRAYANVTFHGAHQQAKLEYVHQLQDAMKELKEETDLIANEEPVGSYLFETATPVYLEMQRRHEIAMNPVAGHLAVSITGAGFLWYLGTTPAAAAVNLTQTPLVAFPTLAARFNGLGAAKELAAAAKLYAGAWRGPLENRLRGDERAAFDEARRIGLFEKTQAHDLAGVTEMGASHYGSVQHTTMKVGALMFHKAEQMNREVTFLAAYRLSRQAGRTHDQALLEAEDLTWDSHFDYNTENRPRWMQGDLLRVLTLFKQYSLNMTYRINMDIVKSFAGETQAVKVEARKRFLGMMMMAATLSGITGLPAIMTESVKFVANLFRDDEEELIDAEDAFRAYLADLYGPKMAEAIMKGPMDALFGMTLSSRVSLNELWMRDPTAFDMDKPWIDRFIMDVAAGPVIGAVRDFGEGAAQVAGGEPRGVERMVPKAIRDILRGMRLNAEGLLSTGIPKDVIVPQEDIRGSDIFWQMFGFTPARITMQYEQNAALREAEKKITDRRSAVIDSIALGIFNDDKRAVAEGYKQLHAFNTAYPMMAITGDTIQSSVGTRVERSARSIGGVALSRRLVYLYDRMNFTPPRNPEEETE